MTYFNKIDEAPTEFSSSESYFITNSLLKSVLGLFISNVEDCSLFIYTCTFYNCSNFRGGAIYYKCMHNQIKTNIEIENTCFSSNTLIYNNTDSSDFTFYLQRTFNGYQQYNTSLFQRISTCNHKSTETHFRDTMTIGGGSFVFNELNSSDNSLSQRSFMWVRSINNDLCRISYSTISNNTNNVENHDFFAHASDTADVGNLTISYVNFINNEANVLLSFGSKEDAFSDTISKCGFFGNNVTSYVSGNFIISGCAYDTNFTTINGESQQNDNNINNYNDIYSQKVIYYLNTRFCEAITQNLKRITCNNQKYSFLSLSSLISVFITISIPS